VRHDQLCESGSLSAISGSFGPSKGCQCASRAWERDPLLDDVTPIWTPVWARNTEDDET